MWSGLKSVFSKLGKSAAFKGTLAAIGTATAGIVAARLGGVAAERGISPAEQERLAAAGQSGGLPPGSAFMQQIPWGAILTVTVIGLVVFAVVKAVK